MDWKKSTTTALTVSVITNHKPMVVNFKNDVATLSRGCTSTSITYEFCASQDKYYSR